jgi:hypothetical protein
MLKLKEPNEKQRELIGHSVCKCHFAATQQTVAFGGVATFPGGPPQAANASRWEI